MIAQNGAPARTAARTLIERGWEHASWLEGELDELPPAQLRSGPEDHPLWEPSVLLRRFIDRLPRRGRALEVACGSGRDATWLALRGLDVLGVDLLPDALRQARALARRARPRPALARLGPVQTASARLAREGRSAAPCAPDLNRSGAFGCARFQRADLTDRVTVDRLLRPARYDVVACFRYLDRGLLPRLADALAPGGWLIYQTFLEAQARAGRKPRRPAFLLKPGELRSAFPGLEVLHYEEGPDARGDHLASLVARTPRRRTR